jgi:hypothetical protein
MGYGRATASILCFEDNEARALAFAKMIEVAWILYSVFHNFEGIMAILSGKWR